jgi:preprotein translocase subunit YajC
MSLFAQVAAEGQAAADVPANGAKPPEPGPSPLFQLATLFLPLILLFYFLILRPERRKQADHKLLLAALKKNDRVVTIGGIYGIVANIQPDADRVTLKIDEATNTKIDVTFGSIARVIAAEPEAKKE